MTDKQDFFSEDLTIFSSDFFDDLAHNDHFSQQTTKHFVKLVKSLYKLIYKTDDNLLNEWFENEMYEEWEDYNLFKLAILKLYYQLLEIPGIKLTKDQNKVYSILEELYPILEPEK